MNRISSIEWISSDAAEAILTLTDGVYSARVFCHPCKYKIGDLIDGAVDAFGVISIEVAAGPVGVHADENALSCAITGVVDFVDPPILRVGKLRFDIGDGELPVGVEMGDFLTVRCLRLDTD